MTRIWFVVLMVAGCAAPQNRSYAQDTTAQKAAYRGQLQEIREPPLSQQQLDQNTQPLTPMEPEPTPLRP